MTTTTFDDAKALAWYRARYDDDATTDDLALARLAAWAEGRSLGPEIHEIPLRDGDLWPPPFLLYQQAGATAEDEFEASVIDRAALPDWGDLGDRRRFIVPMQLEVTAASKAEALERAMQWRDAIGCPELSGMTVNELDVEWHLHHPWGC